MEAANTPGSVPPVAASQFWDASTMETAHSCIAAIWQNEADRLLRQSFRILHKVNGADVEGIVGDALVAVLEAWETIVDAEHCRKLLATAVRNKALNLIVTTHTVGFGRQDIPEPTAETTKGHDAMLTMVFGLCADETEQRILSIWMLPGNQTYEATADATQHWVARWSAMDVKQLMRRLRDRMGVQCASARALRFTTIGTVPGLHCQRHTTLGSVVLIASGGREYTHGERMSARARVPRMRMERGEWVTSDMEAVWSTA